MIGSLVSLSLLIAAANPWKSAPALPEGIAGFGHGVLEQKLVVFGGTAWHGDTKLTLDTAWTLDGNWHALPHLPRGFAYGVFWNAGETVVGCAGDDGARTHRDGFSLPRMAAPPELPHPLAYAGCASDGARTYVLGGTQDIRDLRQPQAGFLTLDDGKWTRLPDYPGGPVIHAALIAMRDMVLVFPGGIVGSTIQNSAECWRFAIPSRHWQRIADYPMAVRGLAACVLNDRFILLAGGDTGSGNTDRCYCYDMTANRYVNAPSLPVAAMMVGLERVGQWVYALGGEDRARHRSAAVYRARVEDLLPH